jgi:hypothetical protein
MLIGAGVGIGALFSIIALCVWWENRPANKMEWPIICPGCGVEGTVSRFSSSSGPRALPHGFKYVGHTCEGCYHKFMVALGKEW